jgi:hypothetical protein
MKLQDLSFPFFNSNKLHHTHLFSLVCTGCLQVPSYYRCRIGCENWSHTLAQDDREYGADGDIWSCEGESNGWLEKTALLVVWTHQIWLAG